MSCFPLVPFSNRIRNGRFTFRGRTVTLPPNFPPEPHNIHGQGWRAAWTVVDHADTHLTIEYRHAAGDWPFAYRARQHYGLSGDRLDVTITVTNEALEAMPVGFGLHPYFVRTPRTRLRARVRQFWKEDDDSMPTELVPVLDTIPLATGLNPDAVALDTNFLGFGGTAHIEWPEHDARLRLVTDGPFGCLVVYTPPGQPFFCVEPATNCIDAFNLAAAGRADTGMLVLDAGATVSGTVRFLPAVGTGRASR
jgi:aldose 1-epimerase